MIEAMQEVGVDLSGRKPRRLMIEMQLHADWAVTMGCGDACPYVPTTVEAWDIPDPAGLPVEQVRPIRDRIQTRVRDLIENKLDAIRTDRTAHQARLALLLPQLSREFDGERSAWEIRALRSSLIELAANCVAAAITLHGLCEHDVSRAQRDERRRQIVELGSEGRRIGDHLRRAIARRTAVGPDRGALVALAGAIGEATARLTRLAQLNSDPVEPDRRTAIAGILRDLTRVNLQATRELDSDLENQQERWAAAARLLSEGRVVIRAQAAAATETLEPLQRRDQILAVTLP